MEVIDYNDDTVSTFKTGKNVVSLLSGTYLCGMQYLNDSNYEIIYCTGNGNVRFFDLTKNIMVKEVKCGRENKRSIQQLFGNSEYEVMTTTNDDKSVYYVLNSGTKDITVINQDLEVVTYIADKDPLFGIFQLETPNYQTIAVTEKKVYRITNENTLVPIYEFNEKPKICDFLEENGRAILWTDKEMVVIDAANCEIKNQYCWYVKKDEVGSKLSKGTQRYWFLKTL